MKPTRQNLTIFLGCLIFIAAVMDSQGGVLEASSVGWKVHKGTLETQDTTPADSASTVPDPIQSSEYVQFLPTVKTVPVSSSGFQPMAPYYTTFYYPWYKSVGIDGSWSYWQDHNNDPPNTWFSHFLPDPNPETFDPATELYSSNDLQTIYWQLTKMAEARQEVAVSSWWGQGHKTDTTFRHIVADVMNRQDNPYPNLRWSLYYEAEADSDPTVAEIVDDLDYVIEHYIDQPAFLKIDGKPVMFVYASGDDDVEMVKRWTEANSQAQTPFYLVLKVFSGFKKVTPQPDSWHQYGPASRFSDHSPYAYSVSPGFWLADGASPELLPRNLDEFRDAVANMVAADTAWKIVLTWNEWGEGSSVEPGEQVRFNADTGRQEPDPQGAPFKNLYIDALRTLLPPLEEGTGISKTTFMFGAGGDHGANSATSASLDLLATSGADFYLALGDLSYSNVTPETAWCDFVHDHIGESFPFEILVGNHEDRIGDDGYIENFATCMPDRLGVIGEYPYRYYFDYPADAPLARFILIDPNLYRGDSRSEYCKEGETIECDWLQTRIDEAKALGLWTVVGMHKNCITLGSKPCEIGSELLDLLVKNKVDLVLQGHEHNYQRSKQLAVSPECPGIVVDGYDSDCVMDDGADGFYAKAQGTIIVISGVFGVSSPPIDPADPEAGYFTKWMDATTAPFHGFMKYEVSQNRIQAQFMNSKGSFSDSFTITSAD